MGKSTKPTKWFKAVKKAFRSPSKERPSPRDKGDADEKLLSTKHDFPPAAPTPHPLPSFEIVAQNEQPQHYNSSTTHWPLPALPADTETPVAKLKEVEEEEPQHQDVDDDDSTLSEDDEAVLRIQQRWNRSPLALKGLIRLQALVRGQLVRRQAATTLRTMEAIVRIQALFRGRRVRMSSDGRAVRARIQSRSHRAAAGEHARRRDDLSREMESETSEADLHEANKRKRRTAYLLTQQLKRSTPNRSSSFIDCDPDQPHEGWAWLELWTNAKAWEGRQLEAAAECKDSKDYIEIIPNSRTSGYVTTVSKDASKSTYSYENGHAAATGFPANFELKDFEEGALKGISTTSPKLTTPSPAVSEDAVADHTSINLPPPSSPQASEASVGQPEEHSSTLAMEPFVLPQAHNGTDDVPNGRSLSDSFSTSNDVHQPATDPEAPAVANETNEHQENMDCNNINNNKEAKKEESPVVPSKRIAACRYMAATESAKAKFRSSSNPKSRGSSLELQLSSESPGAPQTCAPKHRTSLGGSPAAGAPPLLVSSNKAVESPGKTPVAFGTRKTTSNTAVQNRRSPSPKIIGASKEKPRSIDATAHGVKPRSIDATAHGGVSPARRNSLGNGDDKRWRT